MSLLAASATASRHLRRHLLASANASTASQLIRTGVVPGAAAQPRQFASKAAGSGLRRTQSKGRRTSASRPKASQPASATTESAAASEPHRADPHAIANEMVRGAAEGRTPGTESVATLTNEQKMSNFAMAGGLLAFVSYIFYYSLASVGGDKNARALLMGEEPKQEGEVEAGFEEFLKEANEGRTLEEQRAKEEREARGEARELAERESSTAARLKAEGVDEAMVGSATEEEEREMARAAGFVEEGGGGATKRRPLWKRVVFFWRRE